MAKRVCSTPGCPTISDKTKCPDCRRKAERARGSSTQRGYGADHQRDRKAWEPLVATGAVTCRRAPYGLCLEPSPLITPDAAWDLGHPTVECPAPKAPEHQRCNRATNRRSA